MSSPTVRSLNLLKKEGYIAQVVEKYNAFAHVRIDLFGFIDVVAIHKDQTGVLGVQTTSASNMSARLTKIKANPHYLLWIKSGNKIELHGWSKKGKSGKRKLWQVNRLVIDS